MKTYIFVYDTKTDLIDSVLNDTNKVLSYQEKLSNCIFLKSDLDVNTLAEDIRSCMRGNRFLLLEVGDNKRQGWLPKDSWRFLRSDEE